jgi:probable HAF family extracellular repeat protein
MPLCSRAEPLYAATFLPGVDFAPTGMNNAGQIVGFAGTGDSAVHAMLYSGGILSDLGSLGGKDSYANAINDAGAVTGSFVSASGEQHAFLYRHGNVLDLGAGTAGYGINAQGDVVGSKQTAEGMNGFVYSNGSLTELGNLGAGKNGFAASINDHGSIVGESGTGPSANGTPVHPFLYRKGALSDLGTLAGRDFNGATGINNAGQVAGYSEGADGAMHAFLYQHGLMQDLGGFGGAELDIHDLNEHGTLVGTASTEEEGLIPFMNIGDALIDLNTLLDPALGWHIFSAYANNDLGQIVGYGCQGDTCGLVRLDLLSAVPEPGAAWLLFAGLLVIAGARQRRLDEGSVKKMRRQVFAMQ